MSKIWICAFSSFRVYEGFLIPAWLVILIAVLWNEHKSAVLCVLTPHITLRMAVNSNVCGVVCKANLRILWTFVGFLLQGWQIRCSWPSSCQVTLTLNSDFVSVSNLFSLFSSPPWVLQLELCFYLFTDHCYSRGNTLQISFLGIYCFIHSVAYFSCISFYCKAKTHEFIYYLI